MYALLDDDFRVRNGIPGSPEMPSTDVTMKSMAKTLVLKACTVLHLLEVFTRTERVRDEYIVPLLDLCFESFSIDTASAIQHAALGFISACFLHNTTLRDHILSELVLLTDAPGKGVKVFKLHSRDGYISVVSATILSVLQGCPSISSYASNDGGLLIQFEAQQVEVSIKENVCTSFSESQKYVRAFIFQFVQRTMARSDSIPLLRSYLMRFIDDLKAVLFSAEWPVASDCLYFLCSFFSNMIGKSEFSINKRSVCIEALGSIFSRLQGFRMQLRDTPFVIRDKVVDFNPDGSVYDDAEQTQCVCGQEAHTELMIDCDSCHCWFHGKCVNITDEDVETIQRTGWVCGICTVRKEILDENMDYRDSRVDQTMISRQLLGNYLLNLKHKNPLHFQARFYHIARWISEEVNASEKKNISIPSDTIKLYQREWARDLPSIGQSLTLLTDTNDRIALKLAENCSLLLNFNTILRVLLKALTTKYVVLRSRVVKAIGEVVQVDPSILSDSSIQWAMKNGIVDKGSSVREAVVDLLGKYLLTQSHLIDSYFDMLAARVNDQGLSVRKRAIKIIQSLCLEYPNHTRYAGFCRILIERVDDEESIRDLVVSTIEKMWFSDSSKVISCRQRGTALSADFHGLVHQIVDTAAMLPSTEKLVQVITAVLQSPSSRGSVECCQDICICIVTHVLALDDSDPEAYPGILACIKTLAMFCEIRPSFVQPHCESLEPLLKGASGTEDDAELVSLVVRIITMAFPLLSEPRPTFVSNLEADLRTLTLSRPVKVLRTTIPCLCILAKSMSRWNIVRSLFDIYIGRLRSAFPSSTSEPKHLDTACRSLFTVGLLTRFCDPDALGQNTDTVYTLFKAACASSFAKLRVFGVEAMFSFYTRKPTEMLTSERLILGVLDGREHPSVQTHALRSLCEFLDTENMRLSYYQQKDTGATDLKQLPGSFAVVSALSISNDEDNGIISGMLQRYLPKILDLSRSREAGVRRGVLDVLSRFVQQNQVNPQLCVSTIACMSTDEVTQIRLAAQSVLRILINKHMGIVSPSLVPAVLDTYAYHISVLPVFNVYTMIRPVAEGVQNLLDISGASISSSLVSALLESLRFSCNGISKDDSRFNTFIIGILGGLSYSKDEPLTIAYHANKLCANTLGWLQPRLAAHYDTLEPSSTPESQAISRVASSICKLLHLRNWLQGAFTVEGPISAWSPYRSPGTEINSYRKDDAEDMSLLSIYKLDDPALYQLVRYFVVFLLTLHSFWIKSKEMPFQGHRLCSINQHPASENAKHPRIREPLKVIENGLRNPLQDQQKLLTRGDCQTMMMHGNPRISQAPIQQITKYSCTSTLKCLYIRSAYSENSK